MSNPIGGAAHPNCIPLPWVHQLMSIHLHNQPSKLLLLLLPNSFAAYQFSTNEEEWIISSRNCWHWHHCFGCCFCHFSINPCFHQKLQAIYLPVGFVCCFPLYNLGQAIVCLFVFFAFLPVFGNASRRCLERNWCNAMQWMLMSVMARN